MVKKTDLIVTIFGTLLLFSLIMIFTKGGMTTGYITQASTTSNVTISTYFAIAMCTNLSDGIRFGNITALPATDINATHNYDGVNTTLSSPINFASSMCMNVSTDSNSNVDFCVSASDDLKTMGGGDVINVANETYYNDTITNISNPQLASQVALTTTATRAGSNIDQGNYNYYKFWLDIPASQASGTYNNTITFKGVTVGGSCT
jgi:hypothetical protein